METFSLIAVKIPDNNGERRCGHSAGAGQGVIHDRRSAFHLRGAAVGVGD
jgi:hypothetical protein